MIRIYRKPVTGEGKLVRQLVATFHSQNEADFCLAKLQDISTSFTKETLFSPFRYTVEVDPPRIQPADQDSRITIQTHTAKFTKRPITFQMSRRPEAGTDRCICIAYTEKYGTVRGIVEDSVEGRKLFVRRLTAVWPNATISKH